MTPTDFEFTVTMPGDTRLIDVVRQLAVQAGGYAQMTTDWSERFAKNVERVAQVAMTTVPTESRLVHVRVRGDGEAVDVTIGFEAGSGAVTPTMAVSDEVTLDWGFDGARRTCRIRQLLSV